MSDFVNWDFLAKQIGGFTKKSRNEIINPADRQFLDQMTHSIENTKDSVTPSENKETTQDFFANRTSDPESDPQEIDYIEVENVKGKIKKIDPNDYEVIISGKDGNVLVEGRITKIGSGIYEEVLRTNGIKEAVQCLIHDIKTNPEIIFKPSLSFVQAKMIASSLINTFGVIPKNSLSDLKYKLSKTDQKQFAHWMQKKSNS